MVIEHFGEEAWENLRTEVGAPDNFMTFGVYSDDITMQLVEAACKLLDVASDVLLKQFGEYFFEFCKVSGYDHMLRTLGGNLMEFIGNIDALHSFLSLSYEEMNAPSFRLEKRQDGSMLLHYYSDRIGLCHIVPGIIGAAAFDFFNIDITMEILTCMENEKETGKREHVTFLVTQKEAYSHEQCTSPDLFDNQTRDKEQLAKQVCCIVCVWSLSYLIHVEIHPHFEPVYPDTLWIDAKSFCDAFPFHIVFDKELRVKQAGTNIQKIVPGLQIKDIELDKCFTIIRPKIPFKISTVLKFINSQFVFRTNREMMPDMWSDRPSLELRGQMVWMESLECMAYLCSPLLRSLDELQERHMYISDIASHDATRDLILLNHQRLAEMELSNQLERKKEELRILSKNLEEEKKKTETLLYAMLPRHVAHQLKEGKKVEAGEFKECTILFSDIVNFTVICSQCEPMQIVVMLNAMFLMFDRLTTVHDVFKVETIGDGYMVVGGVPIPISSHAERIANFALGMIIASKSVIDPVSKEPTQIRVGITTGPVLAGVVGEKMPRYCLFGDTVNTAARMESHGIPNKIQLSYSTFNMLKGKNFEIQERGEIKVKGKGIMRTYFLIRNLRATEDEIMGRQERESDSGRDSVQSSVDSKDCLYGSPHVTTSPPPPPHPHARRKCAFYRTL
uniref:guanylate cyclase n=1 Tax=Callorhinchus milii TaxID=7868 RepID=A0A4W3JL76_CALMI